MARGYDVTEVKFRLIKLLRDSKTGISGVEISKRLGINRVTMAKYLNIFSAEQIISEKSIGNVNLWFVQDGIEQLQFPDDYLRIQEQYINHVSKCSESGVNNLVRNCLNSEVNVTRLMTEIILPAITQIQLNLDEGNISDTEKEHLSSINIILSNIEQKIKYIL